MLQWDPIEQRRENKHRKETHQKINNYASKVKNLASNQKTPYCEKVREMMVYIFAVWTLNHNLIVQYQQTTDGTGRDHYLQPHTAQIVAIFRACCV